MNGGSRSLPPERSPTSPTPGRNDGGGAFRWLSSATAWLRKAVFELVQSPSATIGALLILGWIFIAIAAPLIAPYSPTEIQGSRLQAPSLDHWLGTDHLGRDVLSRLFWGTQVILFLAPTSVLLGILIGAPLGLISGYVGGRLDAVIMRGVDILLSFPTLLIYILIITSIGSSVIIVVIAIALGSVPPITRIVRSLTLDERTKDYVNAARLRGERRRYILLREILPNVSGPIIVDSCIRVGYAIMAIGSLGFLGLGIPPPTPEWGGMINEGRKWIFSMPWTVVAPAAALSSVVIGLNLLADGIREIGQQR